LIKLLEGVVDEEEFLKEGLKKKNLRSGFCTFKNHVYGYFAECVSRGKYKVVGRWENNEAIEEKLVYSKY
jgi:hypothetical protein